MRSPSANLYIWFACDSTMGHVICPIATAVVA